jgi:hypothetical protein
MSFTIDPTLPPDSESPRLGAQRIRNLTSELLQVLGFTGAGAQTIASPPAVQIDTTTGILLNRSMPGAINLKVIPDGALPLTTVDVTADLVFMIAPTTFVVTPISAFSANCLVVGAQVGSVVNKRDQTAAFGASTFFHLYIIGGNGQTPGTLASLTGPLVGPTLPGSYTSWAYIGTLRINAASNVTSMYIMGNTVSYNTAQSVLSSGSATSSTNVPLGLFVPILASNALIQFSASVNSNATANTAQGLIGLISPVTTANEFYEIDITGSGGANAAGYTGWFEIPNLTLGLYYKWTLNGLSTPNLNLMIQGYRVPNGSS